MTVVHQILAWLVQQAHNVTSVIGAVTSNSTVPARTFLAGQGDAVLALLIAYAVIKIIPKLTK